VVDSSSEEKHVRRNNHLSVATCLALSLLLVIAVSPALVALKLTAADARFHWTRQTLSHDGADFTGIDPYHMWAVGGAGKISYWNGNQWTAQASGTSNTLFGVSAYDYSHVWAVGQGGTIRFFNGANWVVQTSPTTSNLWGVFALSTNSVWAVGEGGTICYYNGYTWSRQTVGSGTNTYWAVSAVDYYHVWVSGNDGIVLFWNGYSWAQQTTGTGYWLRGIFACDAQHVWAVGWNGTVLFYNGHSWALQPSAGSAVMHTVRAPDPTHVWVAGEDGTIRFFDGSSWSVQVSGIGEAMYGLYVYDVGHAWCSGSAGALMVGVGSTPVVSSINPSNGKSGDLLQVNGQAFGPSRGGSYVSFGVADATSYVAWSDNQITFYAPPGLDSGSYDVRVQTEYGLSNAVTFSVGNSPDPGHPFAYYLAEGSTRGAFAEWLCLQNYNDSACEAKVVYMPEGSDNIEKTYGVPGHSRITINVASDAGVNKDLGCVVYSSMPLVVERPMYFWGIQNGGHDTVAPSSLSTIFYFAEGYAQREPGKLFETYLCLLNPNDTTATVNIHYSFPSGSPMNKQYQVPAHARKTVKVNEDIGEPPGGKEVSTALDSDIPILAERPEYFFYNGYCGGGSCVTGRPYTSTTFYFAEGCTANSDPHFDTYVCLGNPGDSDATAVITYMTENGEMFAGAPVFLPAHSRKTVLANNEVPPNQNISITVDSDNPIIAERPTYFTLRGNTYVGGDDVIGINQPYNRFYFAEGCTRSGFEEWFCLENPNDTDANVAITYMTMTGETPVQNVVVPAFSRKTVNVNAFIGPDKDISAVVSSDVPIVAERPMYFNYQSKANGGHVVIGDVR
jgi:hypothetical protein